MIIYISEAIGTFLFVFLSLAIISNALCLNESSNVTLLITSLGVGLAYLVPCIVFGDISGAHFNPAITIATSLLGIFEKRFMWGYIISELLGAFVASFIYLICYYSNIKKCYFDETKIKLFSVYPGKQNYVVSFLKEVLATYILMFAMLAVAFIIKGMATESIYILYFLVIVAVGLAFDYTKVSTNPLRDLFTRFIFVPKCIRNLIDIPYAIVTIIGPILGAILAVLSYQIIPWGK